MKESLTWTLYDTLRVPPGRGQYSFFSRLYGRTLPETNMAFDGQLPKGQEFMINSIEVRAPRRLAEASALRLVVGSFHYLVISTDMASRRPYQLDSMTILLQPSMNFGIDLVVREAPTHEKPAYVRVMLHGFLYRETV